VCRETTADESMTAEESRYLEWMEALCDERLLHSQQTNNTMQKLDFMGGQMALRNLVRFS